LNNETTEHIPSALLDEFSRFIARHMGFHYPADRMGDLQKTLCKAAAELDYDHPVTLINTILSLGAGDKKIVMKTKTGRTWMSMLPIMPGHSFHMEYARTAPQKCTRIFIKTSNEFFKRPYVDSSTPGLIRAPIPLKSIAAFKTRLRHSIGCSGR